MCFVDKLLHMGAHEQVCERHGVQLIVDEAHGAHLGLHPQLPRSAMQQGACVAVQSTHKTLGALTQAAMLHVGHAARAGLEGRIRRHLAVLHTSSPSYLLMASLEAAAHDAAVPSFWDEPLAAADTLRSSLIKAGLPCLCSDVRKFGSVGTVDVPSPAAASETASVSACVQPAHVAVAALDPLRVTCLATAWGVSGFELYRRFEARGVVAELATERCVVFALGAGSRMTDAERAVACVRTLRAELCSEIYPSRIPVPHGSQCDVAPEPCRAHAQTMAAGELMDMRAVLDAEAERVPASRAVGARSASLVSVYPPGIPALVLGQVITAGTVARLQQAVSQGARIVGCSADLSDLQICSDDLQHRA